MGTSIDINNICGTAEAAAILECPKQQIYALRKVQTFPQPFATIAATPLWNKEDIENFKGNWKRRGKRNTVASQSDTIPEA